MNSPVSGDAGILVREVTPPSLVGRKELAKAARARGIRMSLPLDSRFNKTVTRPTMCPFCKGKVVDTLAKVLTETTFWRCRTCDRTWTIATLAASTLRR